MKYLYKTGLVVGRFQSFHKGHEFLIKRALKLCKRVIIYIGSAQDKGTEINPYSYQFRKELISKVFQKEIRFKRVFIKPLYDIGEGNNTNWGLYVLHCFKNDFDKLPDLYITGCEKERSSWFSNEIAPDMDEIRLTRHHIEVSGTECRKALLENKYAEWCKMVPNKLHSCYNDLVKGLKEVYVER